MGCYKGERGTVKLDADKGKGGVKSRSFVGYFMDDPLRESYGTM